MNFNLASIVHQHSLATPDALALCASDRSLAFAEVAIAAARRAACLQQSPAWARADGRPPRVGVLASRSVDACLALLGAGWAGATYVPLGLALPEERLLTVLSLCDLAAIIADETGAQRLSEAVLAACPPLVIAPGAGRLRPPPGGRVRLVDVDDLPTTAASEPAPMAAADTAYIIYTSGTTGVPKGVMISAGAIRHYAAMVADLLDLRPGDRALETCELSFDFSVHNMFSTWQAGASLHVLPAARVMNAVKFARDHGLTVWNSVPSLVGRLRQVKALRAEVLPQLRVTVFGGEPLSTGVAEAWRLAAPNTTVFNLYGPTEVTVFCLSQRVDLPVPLTPGRDFVAIGTPMPGSEAAIFDGEGRRVGDGVPGELAIAGVQLSQGYLNESALTAARFPEIDGQRWYLTGDLALRDAAGIFHCLGRIDNQVKILGHRIELEEIDTHLRAVCHADVVGTVAWPLVDGAAQGLVAFIGAPVVDVGLVLAALRERLPAYMLPERLIALENMPFNPSGKVDRAALRRWLEVESA